MQNDFEQMNAIAMGDHNIGPDNRIISDDEAMPVLAPSSGSGAWTELHVWLLTERKRLAELLRESDFVGHRGEMVATKRMIKKFNELRFKLRLLNEKFSHQPD